MRAGIDQSTSVVLAVDLDQRRAQRLQRLHADRLVVDEGAGAAVGELHAAQNQRLVGRDVAFGQQGARRMLRRKLEHRGDLALLRALTHQRGVAAAAERQRERVEQDRLAGAGLAGQHRKGPTRNRCRACRSGRCRGSRAGPAWPVPNPCVHPAAKAEDPTGPDGSNKTLSGCPPRRSSDPWVSEPLWMARSASCGWRMAAGTSRRPC